MSRGLTVTQSVMITAESCWSILWHLLYFVRHLLPVLKGEGIRFYGAILGFKITICHIDKGTQTDVHLHWAKSEFWKWLLYFKKRCKAIEFDHIVTIKFWDKLNEIKFQTSLRDPFADVVYGTHLKGGASKLKAEEERTMFNWFYPFRATFPEVSFQRSQSGIAFPMEAASTVSTLTSAASRALVNLLLVGPVCQVISPSKRVLPVPVWQGELHFSRFWNTYCMFTQFMWI